MLNKAKITKEQVITSVSALVLVVCSAVLVLKVHPLYKKQVAQAGRLVVAERELSLYRTFATNTTDYDTLYAERKAHLTKAQQRLPSKLSAAVLLKEYSDMAVRSGVELLAITPKGAGKEGKLTTQSMELTIKGNYANVLHYLTQLESKEGGCRTLRNVIVRSDTSQGPEGILTMQGTCVAYGI